MKFVNNVQDAEIVFGVMEKGSDGIIFTSREMMEIEEMSKLIEKANQVQLNLETGKVQILNILEWDAEYALIRRQFQIRMKEC